MEGDLGHDAVLQAGRDRVGGGTGLLGQGTPAGNRERVHPLHPEIGACLVQPREFAPELGTMGHVWPAHRNPVEEGDDRRRAARQPADGRAVLHPQRHGADQPAPGEVVHQPDEEGQLLFVHPLLVEREDVEGLRGVEQEIGIGDALGDALEGEQIADAEARHEGGELVIRHFGVDGQGRALSVQAYSAAAGGASPRNSRGSGKNTSSLAVETVSTRTS